MKNFYVTYTFPSADSRDGFLQEVRLLADITRKEQGCLRYDYFYPVDSENTLFLWEQWETAQDQEKHTKQPHFALIGKLKEKYSASSSVSVQECNQ